MGSSFRFRGRWAAALTVISVVLVAIGIRNLNQAGDPADPIDYIRLALEEVPIVCLSEGGHATREPHLFLRRLLSDRSILEAVDVIILEFAAGLHQAVLDAYIRGDDVPFATLSHVWRDTGQSPMGPWDSPLYQELLEVIRDANRDLPPDKKVRVVAGDPPIDWEQIQTVEDFRSARLPRDPYGAELAMEQAFQEGNRVLIIFGGAHMTRVPIGPEDPRNSLTYRILSEHPDAVRAISFLSPEDLGVEDRIGELVPETVYSTHDHWVGEINGGLVFPLIYSLVPNPSTGEQEWQEVTLYSDYQVRDLFDALIYIGPTSDWEFVPASFDPVRDAEYLAELNRRSMLRFGRPFESGG
jgi:hypothetical protein